MLVRVRAASLNVADWYAVTGRPWVARATTGLRGPTERQGDHVFGGRTGACAEYVVAKSDRAIVKKPANVSFESAAAVPVAATTALQAIRDQGRLEEAQRVLVHGASGGVGTYAVQIAKALGGQVTAVCGPQGVEIARSLGADEVVDYSREDVTRSDRRFDLAIDIAGTRPFRQLRRVLTPQATVVVVGGRRANRLLGPLAHMAGGRIGGMLASQRAAYFLAKLGKADMNTLGELLEQVVDNIFPYNRLPDALEHMGAGHPRGKIVVTMQDA